MIKQIIVSRGIAGSIGVRSEPRHPAARYRVWKGDADMRHSEAIGFACRMAAQANAELVDETGRLSAENCAALVGAMRISLGLEAG